MRKFIKVMCHGLCVMGLLPILLLITPVFAQQTASPSSSLIDKINAIKKEVASKAAELKNVVSKKLQNKALAGVVLEIDGSKIVIQALNGSRQVLTNEYTDFKSKFKIQSSKLKIKDFSKDDYIIASGDIDDKNILNAKQVVKTQPLASDSAKAIWGQIQSLSNSNIIIKDKDDQKRVIRTSAPTVFLLGSEEASVLDAKIDKFLVAKGKILQDNSIQARFVYFIPAQGFVKPEKKPEATFPASPSGSPKKN